jgi:hypothetical protein
LDAKQRQALRQEQVNAEQRQKIAKKITHFTQRVDGLIFEKTGPARFAQ